MFLAAAEESGNDLVQGRGDAYCGMLNASYNLKLRNIRAYIPEYPVGVISYWASFSRISGFLFPAPSSSSISFTTADILSSPLCRLNASYNLKLRNIRAYIPEYPVGDAQECADMIHEFVPIAKAIEGLHHLKIISFGPRPLNFLACNAPIKQLYNIGVEIEENSEQKHLRTLKMFGKQCFRYLRPEIAKIYYQRIASRLWQKCCTGKPVCRHGRLPGWRWRNKKGQKNLKNSKVILFKRKATEGIIVLIYKPGTGNGWTTRKGKEKER